MRTTTQWVEGPLTNPIAPSLDFENPIEPDFLTCSNRAMTQCWRQFGTSQVSFSNCMYGFLVASRLLPPGVATLADQARVSTTGAFARGASLSCDLVTPDPGMMVAYY